MDADTMIDDIIYQEAEISDLAPIRLQPSAAQSFSVLRHAYCPDWSPGDDSAVVAGALMVQLLELLADRIEVDERWYRSTYPDIARAIAEGKFSSARHHYRTFGYFEDRLPHAIEVDEGYYAYHNRDIAEGVAAGRIASCQAHFEQYGFREGRLPFAGWRLIANG